MWIMISRGKRIPEVDEDHRRRICAALQRPRSAAKRCARCGCRNSPCSSCCSPLRICITRTPATRLAARCPCRWRWQNATRAWGARSTTASRVEKILVEGDQAVGVRLADGSEHRAGRVISAADGYTTIFKMLDGKYAMKRRASRTRSGLSSRRCYLWVWA